MSSDIQSCSVQSSESRVSYPQFVALAAQILESDGSTPRSQGAMPTALREAVRELQGIQQAL